MAKKFSFVLLEDGDYLALDLGGTNFRVILLRIKTGSIISEEVQYYQVPEDIRLGPGEKLFDFLAECIHNFMDIRQLKGKNLPLGESLVKKFFQNKLDNKSNLFSCFGV